MRVGNFSGAVRQSEGLTQLFLSGDPRQMLTLAAGARKPNWPAPPRRLTPKHNPPENTKQIRNQNTNKYKTKLSNKYKYNFSIAVLCTKSKAHIAHYQQIQQIPLFHNLKILWSNSVFSKPLVKYPLFTVTIAIVLNQCDVTKAI